MGPKPTKRRRDREGSYDDDDDYGGGGFGGGADDDHFADYGVRDLRALKLTPGSGQVWNLLCVVLWACCVSCCVACCCHAPVLAAGLPPRLSLAPTVSRPPPRVRLQWHCGGVRPRPLHAWHGAAQANAHCFAPPLLPARLCCRVLTDLSHCVNATALLSAALSYSFFLLGPPSDLRNLNQPPGAAVRVRLRQRRWLRVFHG